MIASQRVSRYRRYPSGAREGEARKARVELLKHRYADKYTLKAVYDE